MDDEKQSRVKDAAAALLAKTTDKSSPEALALAEALAPDDVDGYWVMGEHGSLRAGGVTPIQFKTQESAEAVADALTRATGARYRAEVDGPTMNRQRDAALKAEEAAAAEEPAAAPVKGKKR